MASPRTAYPDNVAGDFFVDRSCIDCGTCYELSPEVFAESADHARVHRQPDGGDAATSRAEMALVACPTGSIGTRTKHDLRPRPSRVPDAVRGLASSSAASRRRKSFGAWSWLIRRPDGNVLVDSPRANARAHGSDRGDGRRPLARPHPRRRRRRPRRVRRARFGCERVMHAADVADFGDRARRAPDRGRRRGRARRRPPRHPDARAHARAHRRLLHARLAVLRRPPLGIPARGLSVRLPHLLLVFVGPPARVDRAPPRSPLPRDPARTRAGPPRRRRRRDARRPRAVARRTSSATSAANSSAMNARFSGRAHRRSIEEPRGVGACRAS